MSRDRPGHLMSMPAPQGAVVQPTLLERIELIPALLRCL